MGKRKKVQNVVKVDVGDYLPVLVQHTSKDGRRIDRAIHQIPTPTPQKNPPHSTFIPSPALADTQDHVFSYVDEPMGEPNSSDRVRPRFPLYNAS